MMVARHEMPGMCHPEARRYDRLARGAIVSDGGQRVAPQITPGSLRDGPRLSIFQAFHAWLPSFHPSGTKVGFPMLTHMGGCRWLKSVEPLLMTNDR
jgi:hypothetical protein